MNSLIFLSLLQSIAVNHQTSNSYVIDGSKLRIVQEDLEVIQPITSDSLPLLAPSPSLNDILITSLLTDLDWNSVETILKYGLENVQLGTASSTDFPLLLAENYFNTSERKEKVQIPFPCTLLTHPTSLLYCFDLSSLAL